MAYSLGAFEPFMRLSYERDYSITEVRVVGGGPQPANDHDGMLIGLGLRYFGNGSLSGNIEWNRRLLRDNYNEDTLIMTIRGQF